MESNENSHRLLGECKLDQFRKHFGITSQVDHAPSLEPSNSAQSKVCSRRQDSTDGNDFAVKLPITEHWCCARCCCIFNMN